MYTLTDPHVLASALRAGLRMAGLPARPEGGFFNRPLGRAVLADRLPVPR